jgi:hypothetical protein
VFDEFGRATLSAVIARLDRAIQYSETSVMEARSHGVLDTPLELVIGLAGGETRWRSMTACCGASQCFAEPVIGPYSRDPLAMTLLISLWK